MKEWFYGPTGHPGLRTTIEDAEEVFLSMDTNCLPFLYHTVKYPDTWLNRLYVSLHPRFPAWLKARARPPLTADYVRMLAARHLSVLARDRSYSPEELKRLLRETEEERLREQLFLALDRLHVHWSDQRSDLSREEFYTLMLEDPMFRLRLQAAIRLTQGRPASTNGIPVLLTAITNRALMTKTYPQPTGALGVGAFHSVPDQAFIWQDKARLALSDVAPDLALAHPVVTNVAHAEAGPEPAR